MMNYSYFNSEAKFRANAQTKAWSYGPKLRVTVRVLIGIPWGWCRRHWSSAFRWAFGGTWPRRPRRPCSSASSPSSRAFSWDRESENLETSFFTFFDCIFCSSFRFCVWLSYGFSLARAKQQRKLRRKTVGFLWGANRDGRDGPKERTGSDVFGCGVSKGWDLAHPARTRSESDPILTALDGPIIKLIRFGLIMAGPMGRSCLYTCINFLSILTF